MKKIILFLAALSSYAQTPNQLRFGNAIGYIIPSGVTTAYFQLNAAAIWWSQGFVAQTAKTLNTVELYCSAVSGTLGSADTVVALYSDTGAGLPNTSIESHTGKCATAATLTVSGFTTTLVAGTQYWIVVTNANGTPASNNFTLAYTNQFAGQTMIPYYVNGDATGSASWGWMVKTSTNSGSAWSAPNSPNIGCILGFSDATYGGVLITNATRPGNVTTTDRIFGKQEVGALFSLPIHAKYNVIGVGMVLSRTSTPGNLQLRLYNGTTLVDTSFAITSAQVTTGSGGDSYYGFFPTVHTIDCTAACTVRVTGNDATSGDANTVGYNPTWITIPNEAPALALAPMNGTLQETKTTDNTVGPPATWTQTATNAVAAWLILDTNGEFTALSNGGSKMAGNNQFLGPNKVE